MVDRIKRKAPSAYSKTPKTVKNNALYNSKVSKEFLYTKDMNATYKVREIYNTYY